MTNATPAPTGATNDETTWKARLGSRVPEALAREVDIFETQIELRKRGKIEEKLFAETRLRRGAYGQRYDNGQRHDGVDTQTITYPSGELTKGPITLWDAPGMQRIKLPYGKITPEQMEVMADAAEEYSDGILHITTRQDVQLHFVHIDDTPDMMRRLAAVGITTREACGNSVRNVTACEYAGVCSDQAFDVTPYAHALTYFLLGHDDTQDFGRKFKVAFSGCEDHPCGLTNFHDLGAIAKTRPRADGSIERGFALYIGGGLGSVPHPAKLFDAFVPEEDLLRTAQAICRVFAHTGERENRARARFKFVIKRMGLDEVNRMIREERDKLRPDPRWTEFMKEQLASGDLAKRAGAPLPDDLSPEVRAWAKYNLRPQAQSGYFVAIAKLPLGDMTSVAARELASIARDLTGGPMRATVEQNVCFRWVSGADVAALHARLAAVGLHEPGAGSITDIVACPGTDTCKLGISSSRGLAGELRKRLKVIDEGAGGADESVRGLRVKMSGCFNACGQHHVADIGFLGVSRNVNGRRVPHFQVVVGGEWTHNAGSFGLAIGAIPSKSVPEMLKRLTERFSREKKDGETFQLFIQRIGKKEVRAMVDAVSPVPAYEVDRSYYSDWGDPREYSIGDMGVGECAGEVVPYVQMALATSEREVFEAQVLLDQGEHAKASDLAVHAMVVGARSLVRELNPNIGEAPDEVTAEFRERLVDTKLFSDPFAGAKFAQYFLRGVEAQRRGDRADSHESAHQLIEEAQLFIDAAHACWQQMVERATKATKTTKLADEAQP